MSLLLRFLRTQRRVKAFCRFGAAHIHIRAGDAAPVKAAYARGVRPDESAGKRRLIDNLFKKQNGAAALERFF